MLKTYDSLSDIFELTIANKKYVHIAERNAETFWNYKHNYIANILNSDEKDFDVPWDLKKMEESLIKKEELMKKIPFNLVSKLVYIFYKKFPFVGRKLFQNFIQIFNFTHVNSPFCNYAEIIAYICTVNFKGE